MHRLKICSTQPYVIRSAAAEISNVQYWRKDTEILFHCIRHRMMKERKREGQREKEKKWESKKRGRERKNDIERQK